MRDVSTYPISETFLSVQGEGVHFGRRAYFVRFFGCNVKCPWCDTRYAWEGIARHQMSVDETVSGICESGAEIAVITGGEPCLYDLRPLLRGLAQSGIAAHLETSGTVEIVENVGAKFSWVALSPKLFCEPRSDAIVRADELKFIVSDISELSRYEKFAELATNAKAIWLHPEWSRATDKKLLRCLCDYVESRGGRYRVGWQLHKCYFVK